MTKTKYIFLILLPFLFIKVVYANDIKEINMDIYVDKMGDAHIKEIWKADLDSGTEGYKPYYNLGNSEIKNFKVKMNNQEFTFTDYWNPSDSFNNKKYKNGFNYLSDGVEICFGISKYGNNTYTLEYDITNFVASLNDADMIFWTLIPAELSDKPEIAKIKIHGDEDFLDTYDVWGYGYGSSTSEGYAYIADGVIEMSKEGPLNSNEYMTILAKFPKGIFNSSNSINEDFSYYLSMAEEGATHYTEDDYDYKYDDNNFSSIFSVLFSFFIIFINALIFFVVFKSALQEKYGTRNLKFNKGKHKIKNAPYFRDIPCDKDIFKIYWFACVYKQVKNKNDFLGAILLKWLKNGNVQNVSVKKNKKALKLVKKDNLNELEIKLYDMMEKASLDGVLENNEFTNWCEDNYETILNWFNEVIDSVTDYYINNNLITKTSGVFSKYLVNDQLYEIAKEVAGLKRFLNDFSLIKDRSAIEVKLWDEYLMAAQIFGIADKVAKEFKRLYPEVLTDSVYEDIIFIHAISYNGISSARSAKRSAEFEKASNYTGGGGGFSSGGGGGGSFGGGSGGGGFR